MDITHEVKNGDGDTCGFMASGKYYTHGMVLANLASFENIKVHNGEIRSKKEPLPVIHKRDVNKGIYDSLEHRYSLSRDVQKELERWKEKYGEYVLYLTGARQVGKTTELLKFAYKNYEQVVYINLSYPGESERFWNCIRNNDIFLGVSKYCDLTLLEKFKNSESTILVIDEIQENVNIYNSIRAMQAGLDCNIAVTGSYLGKTLNSKYFKPAGNVWQVELLPLSFSEFCEAFDCRKMLETVNIHGEGEQERYNQLYELYSIYIQVGGYPSVVVDYKRDESIDSCLNVLEQLIKRFTEESEAYFVDATGKSKIVFDNVYTEAFRSMAFEKKGTSSKDIEIITDFVKQSTQEHVSRGEVNKAIAWLKYSGIIGSCDLYNQGSISDLLPERRFYFMDCGIANCISRRTSINNITVKGVLTENFAYTELYRLYKTNAVKGDKPCCSVYKNYELDFMIVDRNDTKYGIEIKTSDSGNPTSLLVYLNDKKVDKGYLAGKTRGGVRKDIYSIPIYTVGCRFPYE